MTKTSLLVAVLCALTISTTRSQSIYEPYYFTTLAGSALNSGTDDNTGSLARFNQPWGLAVDGAHNVYVADALNQVIRKITTGGVVTTIAGVAGSAGFNNGATGTALFSRPTGVAVNNAGTIIYVADYNNHVIRQISGGTVSTLAGSAGTFGTTDATGIAAQFHNPFGVALNSAGTILYVADMNNQTIRAITISSGAVTTLAGAAGVPGSTDDPANNLNARFNTPRGLAVDASGNVYVADAGNFTVRKIASGGGVSTLAGTANLNGFTDGACNVALFSSLFSMSPFGGPSGVAVDSGGNVYVADQRNHLIRKITSGGSVTTLAGLAQTSGSPDGAGSVARFNFPAGIALDGAGTLYVADTANHTIRVGIVANTNNSCITFTAPTNKMVACGTAWDFDAPANIADACCTNFRVVFNTVTNGLCPLVIVRTWWVSDGCGNTTNCSQTVTVNPAPVCVACASWTPRDSVRGWYWVASSANGNNLVAVESFGKIYTSTDAGMTWAARTAVNANWQSVASDTTGQKLVASASPGQLYTSTDYGVTWTAQTSATQTWRTVTSDATGQHLAAVVDNDYIYTSADSGATWTARNTGIGAQHWLPIVTSASGQYLVAAVHNGPLYASTDYGVTWTIQASAGNFAWQSLAASASGQHLVAGGYPGLLYTSADYGNTWTSRTTFSNNWYAIASSSDGAKLVAAAFNDAIYCSTDYGVTWTPHQGGHYWNGVAASADASKLVAVAQNDQIYTAACDATPMITAATNKTVNAGTTWNFDAPTLNGGCSGTNNITVTVLNTVTNGVCPQLITRTWQATDACTNSATSSQTVTVQCVTNTPGICTNFVVNGSFEITSPAISPGSFNNALDPLTGVPGWTTATTNYLEVWANTVSGIPATDGTNQLEINAQSADETVSQTVTGLSTTCPVTFCFDYTGRFGAATNGAGASTPNNDFTVSITGKDFAFSVPLNPVAYATGGWLRFCTNFVPPDASFTIAFHGQPHYSDGTIYTQGGSHIDNVSLTQCCLTNACTTPPIISCPTNTIVVALNKDCLLEIPTIQPKATDACTPGGQLTYLQDPPAGTVVAGSSRTVTLVVQDARGNASQCQVQVYGQDKTPPTLNYPKSVPLTNCVVPNVIALVTASDPCTPTNKLIFTQSPPAGTQISPGVNQVSVTVTDPSGNATTQIIPLTSSGGQSFLNVMFNTGVDANKNVLTTSVIDPHYTLGPVPSGTQTGPSYYNAPNAICESSFLWLPPLTASRWIDINDAASPAGGFPAGNYTYTNHFVLPAGVDPLTASISGRWATCASATMYLNGLAPTNQVAAIVATNLFPPWNSFIINGGILAYPAVNNLYFVVTNIDAPLSSGDIENPYPIYFNTTRLRVEYTDASSSCGTCTPPTILQTALNQSRPLNGTAVFNATVGGTPPFTIVWYHNGHSLTNGGHYSGATTTTLTVSPLSYADAGTYEVDVYGPCGKAASAPAKLTVTHGWGPWTWAWWDFHDRLNPMKAAVGPDLVLMTGTNIFGISSGSTFDFGLPNIGGKNANVLNIPPLLPAGTFLQLPAVGPLDSSYVSNYTLIADVFVPSNSPTRSLILSIYDRWGNLFVTASPTGTLSLSGLVGNTTINQDYSMALMPNAWNRVALVIETTASDSGSNAVRSVCLSNLKQLGTAFGTISPSGSNTVLTATIGTSPNCGTNGEVYLSGIQFHATAFTPEMIAGLGLPANGPLTANDTAVSTTPMMMSKMSGGMVNFMWSGGAFLLQETTDLSRGTWTESNLPFDEQANVNGKVTTTAHADPTLEGPAKYYRLIYQP